ncbi:MAG: hypothetical protein AB8B53_03710 [Flavobacteriales bacterium]
MIHRIEHKIFNPEWILRMPIEIEQEALSTEWQNDQQELFSYPCAQEFYVESVYSMS